MENELIIIPKPDYISWEEITALLHLAHEERAQEGLYYGAYTQTVEKTIRRVGDGVCLVALLDGKLVGTATLQIQSEKGKKYAYGSQLAVHPSYKRYGIGSILDKKRIELCNQVYVLYIDTSEKAKTLINWRIKAGWQKIGFLSHKGTNYYSIKFRLPINGRKYSKFESWIRFYVSVVICKILKKENGEWTVLGKIARNIKKCLA
jgi:GNAT superfamily N-acetyltransferase